MYIFTLERNSLCLNIVSVLKYKCKIIHLSTYLSYAELNRKPDACSICEEYTTEILDYLKNNKTQAKIIDDLHNTCHQLPAFSEQVCLLCLILFCLYMCSSVVLNFCKI